MSSLIETIAKDLSSFDVNPIGPLLSTRRERPGLPARTGLLARWQHRRAPAGLAGIERR